jgi:ssDNA-binding Zn-finger/Zn-ribbon topoisomerase 1
MIGFIKKLLGREGPTFDIEKAVGRYLLTLPPCTAKVVIVSPKYGDKHYRCELIVDTDGLVPWAEHHAQSVWSSNKEEQAARKALPIWLRSANLNDPAPTYVSPHFVEVLQPYALDFINEGIVDVICPDCRRVVGDIVMKKLNERREDTWLWWTDEWYCPNDHLLYREDHELHFHLWR